ncbi:MAG: glycosyltransferase, partial [Bryobacteraceae bacterium]
TDDWEGLELFLLPDIEVIRARSGGEVARILESLTAERARTIGDAARRRVLADHTYTSRARDVSSIINGLTGRARPSATQVLV